MKQIWTSEKEGTLNGVPFCETLNNYKAVTTDTNIFVLKGKKEFQRYYDLFPSRKPKSLLEFGIFEGGSALLFADAFEECKIVGIDMRTQNDAVLRHIDRMGFGDRIKLYYELSQNYGSKIRPILATEFPDGIDLIVDDASHLYNLTLESFNIAFPFLRPGGLYVIEDWGWAHWRGWQDNPSFNDKPALSNLLFELSMLCASSPWLISEIFINHGFFAVRKADNCPALDENFDFSTHILSRGKHISLI